MKANSYEEAESLTGTLKALDQLMIIQEYLEHPGEDIRAFVVGNEIVGSMKRKSKKGMWKTNISRGARGIKINLSEELQEMALKTTEVLETKICGVDILESKQGPVVLEANITPGFKGLLKYTGVNPAPKIIRLARDIAKK
jgi:ribosomal protein S6--L-glutamate ligase